MFPSIRRSMHFPWALHKSEHQQRTKLIIVHQPLQTLSRPPVRLLATSVPLWNHRTSSSHATSTSKGNNSATGVATSIIYSENQPSGLPNRISNLTAWTVTPSNMGLARQFEFPTFASAWRFMSVVADECKAKRHHPSWHNTYNQVTVEWTTHKPRGLSVKDVEMAEFCDRTAEEIGLKKQDQEAGSAS